MFKLEMRTDNAAFEDKANETAWILKAIARKIDQGQSEGPCFDSNGNAVGHWVLDDD